MENRETTGWSVPPTFCDRKRRWTDTVCQRSTIVLRKFKYLRWHRRCSCGGGRRTSPATDLQRSTYEQDDEGLHLDRVDDRRRHHRHSRRHRHPELRQVPGALQAERGEGKSQGDVHGAEGVLGREGKGLGEDRKNRLPAGAQ